MAKKSRTVRDILEIYDLENEVEETLKLIHSASDNGVDRINAAPAIVVHVIHSNTDNDWYTICRDLGVDAQKLLRHREVLVKVGVISDKIRKPSQLARGEVKELLKRFEKNHSDKVFDGTNPKSWVAATTYLVEYIHMRDTPISDIAYQYETTSGTIVKALDRIVEFESFDRAISEGEIPPSLGDVLRRRRHTIESLRLTLGDTSNAVRKRIRALEKESEYDVFSEEFGDKTFYWVEEKR